jgi:hypothetical protein
MGHNSNFLQLIAAISRSKSTILGDHQRMLRQFVMVCLKYSPFPVKLLQKTLRDPKARIFHNGRNILRYIKILYESYSWWSLKILKLLILQVLCSVMSMAVRYGFFIVQQWYYQCIPSYTSLQIMPVSVQGLPKFMWNRQQRTSSKSFFKAIHQPIVSLSSHEPHSSRHRHLAGCLQI